MDLVKAMTCLISEEDKGKETKEHNVAPQTNIAQSNCCAAPPPSGFQLLPVHLYRRLPMVAASLNIVSLVQGIHAAGGSSRAACFPPRSMRVVGKGRDHLWLVDRPLCPFFPPHLASLPSPPFLPLCPPLWLSCPALSQSAPSFPAPPPPDPASSLAISTPISRVTTMKPPPWTQSSATAPVAHTSVNARP